MADEDVHRGTEAERAADPDSASQHPGKRLHDALQDAPVEQQGGERADDQHQRERPEGEDEAGAGPGLGKRQLPAAQITENKAGAGLGGALQPLDGPVQQQERRPGQRKSQKHQSEGELQQHAHDDDAPRHARAVLTQPPREQQDDGDAEKPAHRPIRQHIRVV